MISKCTPKNLYHKILNIENPKKIKQIYISQIEDLLIKVNKSIMIITKIFPLIYKSIKIIFQMLKNI